MRNPGRAPKTLDSAALLHPGYVPINGVRPEWHLLKAQNDRHPGAGRDPELLMVALITGFRPAPE